MHWDSERWCTRWEAPSIVAASGSEQDAADAVTMLSSMLREVLDHNESLPTANSPPLRLAISLLPLLQSIRSSGSSSMQRNVHQQPSVSIEVCGSSSSPRLMLSCAAQTGSGSLQKRQLFLVFRNAATDRVIEALSATAAPSRCGSSSGEEAMLSAGAAADELNEAVDFHSSARLFLQTDLCAHLRWTTSSAMPSNFLLPSVDENGTMPQYAGFSLRPGRQSLCSSSTSGIVEAFLVPQVSWLRHGVERGFAIMEPDQAERPSIAALVLSFAGNSSVIQPGKCAERIRSVLEIAIALCYGPLLRATSTEHTAISGVLGLDIVFDSGKALHTCNRTADHGVWRTVCESTLAALTQISSNPCSGVTWCQSHVLKTSANPTPRKVQLRIISSPPTPMPPQTASSRPDSFGKVAVPPLSIQPAVLASTPIESPVVMDAPHALELCPSAPEPQPFDCPPSTDIADGPSATAAAAEQAGGRQDSGEEDHIVAAPSLSDSEDDMPLWKRYEEDVPLWKRYQQSHRATTDPDVATTAPANQFSKAANATSCIKENVARKRLLAAGDGAACDKGRAMEFEAKAPAGPLTVTAVVPPRWPPIDALLIEVPQPPPGVTVGPDASTHTNTTAFIEQFIGSAAVRDAVSDWLRPMLHAMARCGLPPSGSQDDLRAAWCHLWDAVQSLPSEDAAVASPLRAVIFLCSSDATLNSLLLSWCRYVWDSNLDVPFVTAVSMVPAASLTSEEAVSTTVKNHNSPIQLLTYVANRINIRWSGSFVLATSPTMLRACRTASSLKKLPKSPERLRCMSWEPLVHCITTLCSKGIAVEQGDTEAHRQTVAVLEHLRLPKSECIDPVARSLELAANVVATDGGASMPGDWSQMVVSEKEKMRRRVLEATAPLFGSQCEDLLRRPRRPEIAIGCGSLNPELKRSHGGNPDTRKGTTIVVGVVRPPIDVRQTRAGPLSTGGLANSAANAATMSPSAMLQSMRLSEDERRLLVIALRSIFNEELRIAADVLLSDPATHQHHRAAENVGTPCSVMSGVYLSSLSVVMVAFRHVRLAATVRGNLFVVVELNVQGMQSVQASVLSWQHSAMIHGKGSVDGAWASPMPSAVPAAVELGSTVDSDTDKIGEELSNIILPFFRCTCRHRIGERPPRVTPVRKRKLCRHVAQVLLAFLCFSSPPTTSVPTSPVCPVPHHRSEPKSDDLQRKRPRVDQVVAPTEAAPSKKGGRRLLASAALPPTVHRIADPTTAETQPEAVVPPVTPAQTVDFAARLLMPTDGN